MIHIWDHTAAADSNSSGTATHNPAAADAAAGNRERSLASSMVADEGAGGGKQMACRRWTRRQVPIERSMVVEDFQRLDLGFITSKQLRQLVVIHVSRIFIVFLLIGLKDRPLFTKKVQVSVSERSHGSDELTKNSSCSSCLDDLSNLSARMSLSSTSSLYPA
jgi:hypothetical protein